MNLIVHPATHTALQSLVRHPSGTTIFEGPTGIGKTSACLALAAELNCRGTYPDDCASCRQFAGGNSSAILVLERTDKASIGIEQVRSLIHTIGLQPTKDVKIRVVAILDGHLLTTEAQNALLKLLEEPPERTIILITTLHAEALLATVRSRARLVVFRPVESSELAVWIERSKGLKPSAAAQIAKSSAGLPGTALSLAREAGEPSVSFSIHTAPLFDRLIAAGTITDAAAAQALGSELHRKIVSELIAEPAGEAVRVQALGAVEHFRRRLEAGVMPKVATEALMVELP